jgi:hypothetical protein
MKKTIKKTTNALGQQCKTYVLLDEKKLVFHKLTLIKTGSDLRNNMYVGERIVKITRKYILTAHFFSIKIDTLYSVLEDFHIINKKEYDR